MKVVEVVRKKRKTLKKTEVWKPKNTGRVKQRK